MSVEKFLNASKLLLKFTLNLRKITFVKTIIKGQTVIFSIYISFTNGFHIFDNINYLNIHRILLLSKNYESTTGFEFPYNNIVQLGS